MQLTIKGKQIDIGDSLRSHVQDKLSATIAKLFDRTIEGHVTFTREGDLYRCDIAAHVPGELLTVHADASEIYPSFDLAADKLAERLRRFKERLKNHHHTPTEGAVA